jgi:predicted Zn-dependent protease
MGRNRDALTEMRRAQELDPLSLIINGILGMTLSLNGMHEEGLVQLKKTLEMDPNFPRTHIYLPRCIRTWAGSTKRLTNLRNFS